MVEREYVGIEPYLPAKAGTSILKTVSATRHPYTPEILKW